METDFIFAIGDCVTTKGAIEDVASMKRGMGESDMKFNKSIGRTYAPIRLFILERRSQECIAGIQRHYFCRYWTPEGFKSDVFNEIELARYPDEEKVA